MEKTFKGKRVYDNEEQMKVLLGDFNSAKSALVDGADIEVPVVESPKEADPMDDLPF